jgi:hypothetical protein
MRNAYKILVAETERISLGNLDRVGRIIMKWILTKYDTEWIQLAQKRFQHGNESSGFIQV